jgi:tetratricopeptide (TPR) repeat protein
VGLLNDMSVSYNLIGGVLEAKKDFQGALRAFQQHLDLSRALLSRDQEKSVEKRNIAIGEASLACVELALGNLEKAAALQAQAAVTFESRLKVNDAGSQFDWAAVTALGAEIAQASGELQAAVLLQDQLAAVELTKDALVGKFRKRFLPLILKHLDAAAQRGDVAQRSRIAGVALQFALK